MTQHSRRKLPSWLQWIATHQAWLLVALILLMAIGVRLRLRDMPLERDEGEYAYAAQLMLQGVPPYKLAYNMKLPGTYAAYALIMAIFGQTASAIRIGLALLNAASIVLVFILGRKWLDPIAGVAAAAIFALLSLSPSMLGLAAHATHFVVFMSLAAILVLFEGLDRERRILFPISGILFGLAVLLKQHGVFFALCGGLFLGWCRFRRNPRNPWKPVADLAAFAGGVILPYGVTCLVLAWTGVFDEFVFWTVTYAKNYVSMVPGAEAPSYLRAGVGRIFFDNPFFWILAALGTVVMWWEDRLKGVQIFLAAFVICSVLAVSAGFYFREHYFIQLLPALAWLGGIAISRSVYLFKHDRTIELFLAFASLLLLVIALGASFVTYGPIWFTLSPDATSLRVYGTSGFSESAKAGEYVRLHSGKEAKVAVLGSEPEIYFYARRRSATGFIYTYALMETHENAVKMQEQMIDEIERARPEYLIFVNDHFSWAKRSRSEMKIFRWWESYWPAHYDIELTLNISIDVESDKLPTDDNNEVDQSAFQEAKYILVLKRKTSSSQQSTTH